MKHIRTRALFIHRLPALASGVTPVVLLTEELGKIRALVKGLQNAKSKMASKMDPLLELDVELYVMDSHAFLLTQTAALRRFADHSLPYERIEGLWQLFGAVHALLPEEVPHPDIYELMTEFLELLPKVKYPRVLADMTFLKLLELLGHLHISDTCLHCGKDIHQEATVHLRAEDMLLVCDDCVKLLPTATGLSALPHLAYKTLLLYQEKGLLLSDVVSIPAAVAKAAATMIMERYRHVTGM